MNAVERECQPPAPCSRWKLVWREARRSAVLAAVLLIVYAVLIFSYVRRMPTLKESEIVSLRTNFPTKTLTALISVRDVVLSYSSTNPISVAWGLCLVYIMMQTFAIPGTLSLSLLAGAAFGARLGIVFVTVVNAFGSSCCYILSLLIGKPLVRALWPKRLEEFGREVQQQRNHLFNYIVFLRLTPLLPNVFINVASPIVGIPLTPFFWGTFLGCIPNNMVAVNAGNRLSEITSLRELSSPKMLLLGCMAGVVALIPVYLQRRQSLLIQTAQSQSKDKDS